MKNNRILLFILFAMTVAQMGTDIYLPSVPAMMQALQVNHTHVQLTFSLFFIAYALSQIFLYGPLIDRHGRRYPLLLGLSIYTAGNLLAVFAPSITILYIARVLQGLGAGSCSVIPRAIMRDTFTGKALQKANIYQSAVWSIMFLLAPLVGSYIETYLGWRFNFVFLLLLSLIAVTAAFYLDETLTLKEAHAINLKRVLKDYWAILTHSSAMPAIIMAGLTGCALTAFTIFSPIFLQVTLHLTPIQYGWSIAFITGGFFIGIVMNRLLIHRWAGIYFIKIGLYFIAAAALLLSVLALLRVADLWFLAAIFILQFGIAFIFPQIMAIGIGFFPHKAGKAAALFGAAIFIANAITAAIISVVPNNQLGTMAIIYCMLTLGFWLSYRRLQKVVSIEA